MLLYFYDGLRDEILWFLIGLPGREGATGLEGRKGMDWWDSCVIWSNLLIHIGDRGFPGPKGDQG